MKKIIPALIALLMSVAAFSETYSNTIGTKVIGLFKQNDKVVTAELIVRQKDHMNTNGDKAPSQCEIQFSNASIKPIPLHDSCEVILVNEGDLNNDGKDDLSIYQAPHHGCTYSMTTYSLKNKAFKPIVPLFLIPTACDSLSNQEIDKLVFKDKNSIYFMYTDVSNENFTRIKKKVVIK